MQRKTSLVQVRRAGQRNRTEVVLLEESDREPGGGGHICQGFTEQDQILVRADGVGLRFGY